MCWNCRSPTDRRSSPLDAAGYVLSFSANSPRPYSGWSPPPLPSAWWWSLDFGSHLCTNVMVWISRHWNRHGRRGGGWCHLPPPSPDNFVRIAPVPFAIQSWKLSWLTPHSSRAFWMLIHFQVMYAKSLTYDVLSNPSQGHKMSLPLGAHILYVYDFFMEDIIIQTQTRSILLPYITIIKRTLFLHFFYLMWRREWLHRGPFRSSEFSVNNFQSNWDRIEKGTIVLVVNSRIDWYAAWPS